MLNLNEDYRAHFIRTQSIVESTLIRLTNMKTEFDAILNSPNEYSIQHENIRTLCGVLGVEVALHKKHLQNINNEIAKLDARNEDAPTEDTSNE